MAAVRGFVPREGPVVKLLTHRHLALLVPVVVVAGCSSGQVAPRPVAHSGGATSVPAAGVRPARPIPDVTAKPRPFQASAPAPAVRNGPAAQTPQAMPAALAAASAPARRLAPAAFDSPTVAEVRVMLRSYLRAFNRHDAAALAAHWSETGENVDLDSGEVTAAGRAAVRDVFAALFATDDQATIDIDVHAIRPIRDDVAVVDGVSLISFADGTPASSRFSAVVVKQDGQWVLENVREAAAPAPTAPERPLEALDWLVGSWEDDGQGVTAGTRCSWSPGRGFLVRSHVIAPDAVVPQPPAGDDRIPALLPAADQRSRELTEVVGWDPDQGVIRSWIFASDGRFAEATWHRDGARWTIEVAGRGRDEGATATCTLEGDTGDSLTLRCEPGRLSALLPPACGFTRTAR
jgi:uncharacterized protein (TIGR02246 family)